MALQIQKKFVPNPDIIVFQTTVEISQSRIEMFYRPLRNSSSDYLEKVGKRGAKLVERVMIIPGITRVTMVPYEITVERSSSLFDWGKIEPRVEAALKKIFGGEKEEIKYLSLPEVPISVILSEPFRRFKALFIKLIQNAWNRIPNLRY